MDASTAPSPQLPLNLPPQPPLKFEPDTEKIKQTLLKKGVHPTPKILRALRKKETQKHNRKSKRLASEVDLATPLTESQRQALAEESHFQTLKREYKRFSKAIAVKNGDVKSGGGVTLMVGKPWEGIERVRLKELASSRNGEFNGDKLRREYLRELMEMLERDLQWVLEDDVDVEGIDRFGSENREYDPAKRWASEGESIRVLVDRLSRREITEANWKFVRIMKQSGLQFTENQMLKIVERLGGKGCWRQAMAVVRWIYADKERRHFKSRVCFHKTLVRSWECKETPGSSAHFQSDAFLQGDCNIYPDMAAYHSIAVTLGQGGLLRELLKVIECMRQKPKKIKHMRNKNWDPVLEPDCVVYNAVLNACVPSRQWKGVSWVFDQLRKSGLKPNAATYGLAMEVMLESGKYDLVHEFFRKMKRAGEAPKALTYKVLVRAFWKEGKISEAVETIRDMERRGVIGTASVYYELACCLCNSGRWRDAMVEVDKIKKLPHGKPLEVTYTGLISSSMDGGHIDDCIAIFQYMKDHCVPNIGTVNTMLKVYGLSDMFSEAKELFQKVNKARSSRQTCQDDGYIPLIPDQYTYSSMLEASARALQWEYFEYVYKEMTLSGYQLDQTKHALLLVEASRAGKRYILEHAFDSLLEAGEIPHPLFFTEMICEATARGNYERAVSLISTVALAPFQISERQWTDLFEENKDRIRQENLKKLLNALCKCDVSSEPNMSSLSRSLTSLCRIDPSIESISSVSSGNGARRSSSMDSNDEGCDDNKMESLSCSARTSMVCVNTNTYDYSLSKNDGEIASSNSSANKDDAAAEVVMRSSSNHDYNRNHLSELCSKIEVFAMSEEASHESTEFLDSDPSTFNLDQFEIPMMDGGSDGSTLPSAEQILEEWKESRRKDGIIFPFQLGQK